MAWNKLKKLMGLNDNNSDVIAGGTSIHKLVNQNHLNRRKNVRILYPHIGATGLFPRVMHQDHELNIGNVSLGGLLVIDDSERFGFQVGEIVNLDLVWPDFTTRMRARLVGANLQKRHVQFVDFNPQAFLKISLLVRAGHRGQRFHRVRNDSGALQAEEMWLGPTGETLVFLLDDAGAELTLGKEKILIKKGQATYAMQTKKPLVLPQLHDILIMLANFPNLTMAVKELVEHINDEIAANERKKGPSFSRTGTHG